MILPDHLLAIALIATGPIRSATVGFRRLERASSDTLPAVRLAVYRSAIWFQWTLVALCLALWGFARRPWDELGFGLRMTGGLAGVAVGIAIITLLLIRQRGQTLANADELAEVRRRLGRLEMLMPHTSAEFAAFVPVSITAGACEELLYRGYLIWYFAHTLPWWGALLASALAFGLGHAYQGFRGAAQTGLVGAFLGAVFFVTGSLWAPIVIHTLMDLHTGHLAWRAYQREREDAADERAALGEPAGEGAGPVECSEGGPSRAAPVTEAGDVG